MMARLMFIFDQRLCFGCFGCSAACANANEIPAGSSWRDVHKMPPLEGSSGLSWLSLACNHCAEPRCLQACPSGALVKRESDGVVLHHEERCVGCRYCQMACPYDAIRWDDRKGVISKCHFCYERLEEGKQPACVETCFSGALTYKLIEDDGDLDEFALEVPGFIYYSEMRPSIRFITREEKRVPLRERPFPPQVITIKPDRN